MLMSIAETELNSYLVGEKAWVCTICDMIEACEVWFEDHRGIEIQFENIFADITDFNGETARFCISEDSRETDDTLLLKINGVKVTDNWDVLLDAELTITE